MRLRHLVLALVGAAVLLGGSHAFAQAAAPPAGWSATDCQSCHDKAVGPAFQKTKHASGDQSCATCHTNVAEHVKAQMGGDKNAPTPSLKKLTARQINDTCLTCHEKDNQAQLRRAACTRAATWPARRATASTTSKSAKAQLKTEDGRRDVLHVPQVRARQVDAHLAPPGPRGQDGLLELPQPARRQPPEDDAGRVGQRALLQVPHREARAVPLRARAGPRGLRVVPRPARLEPRAAARRRSCRTSAGTATSPARATSGRATTSPPSRACRSRRPEHRAAIPTVNSRFVEKSCKNCHVNIHGSNSPSGAYFVR